MKKIFCFLLVLICATHVSFAAGNMDKWPALKAFHEVISQTYHPSEEGNLVPLKARAKELNKKAINLSKTKAPAEFNTPQIKESVAALQQEAQKLEKMVTENESDSELKAQISVVHDAFHEIVGLCSKNENETDAE